MGMALDMAGDVCDDRGMTATDQTTYFVTCRDNPRGTEIPGTLTADQVRDHLANCPHSHGVTDTSYGYGNGYGHRNGHWEIP